MASTACSKASTSYTSHHDVFINHRGPDVKKTFASHLYHRLISTGLKVFLDKPELVEGQTISSQIKASIQSATLHIAIFSPNYAKSKWCLDELILMKLSGATILPVFYNVKPSQLRWTGKAKDGPYAQALRSHEERYDLETIQKWRDSLSAVSEISGFELDAFNGDEGLLLDAVVRRVLVVLGELRLVDKTPLKYVARHPTGLKKKLQEFEMTVLLQQKAMVVKVVGIVGPGGVGKTTLAKELFNSKRSDYNRACFLPDIRENADKGSLKSLQRKLLHDLTPKDLTRFDLQTEYCSIDEGIENLREHLVSVKALVVLDDVDRASQVEAFLPIKDVLNSDSLILITSRDKQVLSSSGVLGSSIYKLKGLNTFYSRELFCCYAFYQRYPLPKFADLVDKFLIALDGSPLSLKVFGALVSGQNDRSYWQEILDGLNKILPTEIQERLKISYDSLSPNEQEIFLDIACFFPKEDSDRVIRAYGLVGLQNLENKCLLEVDSENLIKMHDQIRDLGRNIAEEGSQPLRLWHHPTNNLDDLLEQSSCVITRVRGITTVNPPVDLYTMVSSDMPWYKRWSDEVFGNCLRHLFNNFRSCGILNLQVVASEGSYLERILRRTRLPHLIWLSWFKCPCSDLPSWIPIKDLRILEIAGRQLKNLWQRESEAPVQLRELNIHAPLSRIPESIGQLKHLEKIVISEALFETLPEEFGDLRSLLYLELKECSKMKSLSDSMGKLTGLQYIDLNRAFLLESLPSSFGNLNRLRHLSLRSCSNLTISNGTLGNISTLQYLDLSYCSNVKELPPQLAHQQSLQKLFVSGTKLKGMPIHIGGDLCQLTSLRLRGECCFEMQPPLLGCLRSLEKLWLFDCPALKYLPDSFGRLTQLTELDIEKCGIEYLPQDLLKMNNLEKLRVSGCPLLELPFKRAEGERGTALLLNKLDSSNEKCLFGLKSLKIVGTNISELCFPKGVCNLQSLWLSGCKELRQIEGLGGLARLRELRIYLCNKVEALHFSECHEIPEMSGVKHPMSLEVLWVRGGRRLRSIQGLGHLTNLQSLDVSECHEIQELPGLEHVMSLQSVRVIGCPKVQWEGGVVEQLRQRLRKRFYTDSGGD